MVWDVEEKLDYGESESPSYQYWKPNYSIGEEIGKAYSPYSDTELTESL